MHHALSLAVSDRCPGCRRFVFWLMVALAAPGCGGKPKSTHTSILEPPTVQVIQPSVRNMVRVIGQPSFIESFERTSIYPKVDAYIESWKVDIGDKVKKGDVLATLFVPEMVEDYGTKNATVRLDKSRIELANKLVNVAEANVEAATARLAEAKAILGKFQAEVDRWDTEIKRLRNETERGVVDPQILLESTNEWKSAIASRDSAKATIMTQQADLLSREAALAKAHVDVTVARDDLAVAQSEARRLKAWVGYLTLTAPYDGVIVTRNANRGDFVLPATGDPGAMERSPTCRTRVLPRQSTWSTAPTWSGSSWTSPSRTPTTSTSRRRQACSSRHTATNRLRAVSRGPRGRSTSRAGRSVPRSTCSTRTASSCPECTPTRK